MRRYRTKMARITILDGHPDSSPTHLVHALAAAYEDALRSLGHEVRRVDLARTDVTFLRSPDDFMHGTPSPPIRDVQRDIAWADHLAIFYPLWMGDAPALFKALVEQVFRPGFAMAYSQTRAFPTPLLAGKSARIVVTMGMPAIVYRTLRGAHALKNLEANLAMVGVAPVRTTLLGGAFELPPRRARRWLGAMRALARRDTCRRSGLPAAVVAIGAASALATAAYAAYAASTWLRYGTNEPDDTLLAAILPRYDVAVRNHALVASSARDAFAAMRTTELERSPLVRALFRLREMLLGARHVSLDAPRGLLERIGALGWTLVAEEPERELVFASVTKPWRGDVAFVGLPRDAFERFDEPGFAKIAFSLRVEGDDPQRCVVRSETRVQTTDARSRARFRRYWALLAPGIELIRLVLLQQIKSEAETHARAYEPSALAERSPIQR